MPNTRCRTTRRWRRLLAVGLASVSSGSLAALTVHTPAQAAPQAVATGAVTWGVKQSFRTYIEGPVADGSVTVAASATRTPSGAFQFPATGGTFDGEARTVAVTTAGHLRFAGHDYGSGPLLDVTISDLRVEVTGTSGRLLADVAARDLESTDPSAPLGELHEYPDIAIATLDLAGVTPIVESDGAVWSNVPAMLTPAGAPAFAGFYTAGQALDPVTFAVAGPGGALPRAAYTPLNPSRLLDTRTGGDTVDGAFAGTGTVAAGGTVELQVGGRGGVPADAEAVALNVTATAAAGTGYVTAWPCGSTRPNASSLNYAAGATVPNLVVMALGAGGKVCLHAAEAATDLLADVAGYFPAGADLVTSTPARLLDTRPGGSTVDGQAAASGLVAAGGVVELFVGGRAGVPADAGAVVLNVTATGTAGTGYVTVWPCGSAPPNASSLNYVADATVANAVISRVGVAGKVCLRAVEAGTHLLADVAGYFPAESDFAALKPARLLDTRPGGSTVDGQAIAGGLVAPTRVVELSVAGRGGVPADAGAVVLNVTATGTDGPGYVTVWPCGAPAPNASSLNYVADQTVPNAVIAKVGATGSVCLLAAEAGTHLLADVTGFFPS